MWSCQAMVLWKMKLSARLMAIRPTIPRVSSCSRLETTNQADGEHGHVGRQQRPGAGGPGARSRNPAAERGPGLAAAPRALAHAYHALLAHRGRAHAVGARVALAPDTGDVGLPAGMAVA